MPRSDAEESCTSSLVRLGSAALSAHCERFDLQRAPELEGTGALNIQQIGLVSGAYGPFLRDRHSNVSNLGEIKSTNGGSAIFIVGASAQDAMILDKKGKMSGSITNSGGMSVITNKGQIQGLMSLGNYDDVYHGETGTVGGGITLGDDLDQAHGGSGAENIDGRQRHDQRRP
jgi:hypothetical protein